MTDEDRARDYTILANYWHGEKVKVLFDEPNPGLQAVTNHQIWGTVYWVGDHYEIRILPDLPFTLELGVFAHEFGHVKSGHVSKLEYSEATMKLSNYLKAAVFEDKLHDLLGKYLPAAETARLTEMYWQREREADEWGEVIFRRIEQWTGLPLTYTLGKGSSEMTASQSAQASIDFLKSRTKELDTELSAIRGEIDEKRRDIGAAMVDNQATEKIQEDIFRLESRMRMVEIGRQAADKRLTEEGERLEMARKAEATERVKGISREMELEANYLEAELKKVNDSAKRFEKLLAEAFEFNRSLGTTLSPLGNYVGMQSTGFSLQLDRLLEYFQQFKPKAE